MEYTIRDICARFTVEYTESRIRYALKRYKEKFNPSFKGKRKVYPETDLPTLEKILIVQKSGKRRAEILREIEGKIISGEGLDLILKRLDRIIEILEADT